MSGSIIITNGRFERETQKDFLEILMESTLYFELPLRERSLLLRYIMETSRSSDLPALQ